jgi:hypothetical protein
MYSDVTSPNPIDRPDAEVVFDTGSLAIWKFAMKLLKAFNPYRILPYPGTFWTSSAPDWTDGSRFPDKLREYLYQKELWEKQMLGVGDNTPDAVKKAFLISRATAPDSLTAFETERLNGHTNLSDAMDVICGISPAEFGDVRLSSWNVTDPAEFFYPQDDGLNTALGQFMIMMGYERMVQNRLFTGVSADTAVGKEKEQFTLIERALRATVLMKYAYMQLPLARLRWVLRFLDLESSQYQLNIVHLPSEMEQFNAWKNRILGLGLHPLAAMFEAPSLVAVRNTRFSQRSRSMGVPRSWLTNILDQYGTTGGIDGNGMSRENALDPLWLYDLVQPLIHHLIRDLDWMEESSRLSLAAATLNCTAQPSPPRIELQGSGLLPVLSDGENTTESLGLARDLPFRVHGSHNEAGTALTGPKWVGELKLIEFKMAPYVGHSSDLMGMLPAAFAVEPEIPELDPDYSSLRVDSRMIQLLNDKFRGGLETTVFPATVLGVAERIGISESELRARILSEPAKWAHLFDVQSSSGVAGGGSTITELAPDDFAFTSPITMRPWLNLIDCPRSAAPTVQVGLKRGHVIGGGPCDAAFKRDLTDPKPMFPAQGAISALIDEVAK